MADEARAPVPTLVDVLSDSLLVLRESGRGEQAARLAARAYARLRQPEPEQAQRTIRGSGVTRYMAVALLAGYAWLCLAGAVWLWAGELAGAGYAYDAMVHAVFLGFVFSMVFAHAPVIVPAVLGVALPYSRVLYAPLALLHAGLALRLAGGLLGDLPAWRLGGLVDETAIVAFFALAAGLAVRARRARAPRPTAAIAGGQAGAG